MPPGISQEYTIGITEGTKEHRTHERYTGGIPEYSSVIPDIPEKNPVENPERHP